MKRSLRAWVVPVVASLLVCSVLAPALFAAPAAAQAGDPGAAGFAVSTQEFEADRVDFEITVYENGSATWTFRYAQSLDGDEDRRAFRDYAEEFETNETQLYTNFQEGAERLTSNGSEVTDREMTAENVQREARVEGLNDDLGVVEMSFRWEGFARVDDDRVVMGDVFEGGLPILSDQRLIVRAGPALSFADVDPDDGEFDEGSMAESDTVTWNGEKTFNPGRPRVEFADSEAAPTATVSPSASDFGWLLPVGALAIVVLLGVGAAVAYRSEAFPIVGGDDGFGSNSGDGGAGATTGGADAGAGAAAGAGAGVPEEELISDEERVVNLLEDNGGRMKQVNIVDETGWSKSKVSMLLSDMEEEGTISKLRVGRENIVSLAGHEPDAAGSPFEDDGQ